MALERALRSEASKFHDQIQLAKKSAPKALRLATVSANGGGPGLPMASPSFAVETSRNNLDRSGDGNGT